MNEPTCGTCRHWTPPTERTDFRNIFRGDDADRLFGICEAINLADSYDPPPDQIPLAVTKDGSDYKADLYTQESFGCVMWEAKA